MGQFSIPQLFAIWTLPVLFAITVHEVSHGWVASKLGDQTARMMGRLTLNPIKHIDLLGTVIVPAFLLITSSFVFGWAKPVPVNYFNLRNPKRDMAFVAVAGPLSNLAMALIWGAVTKLGIWLAMQGYMAGFWMNYMGQAGIMINLVLMVLNLIPIPPLDGSRVAHSLMPNDMARSYSRIEPFGFIILLALMFTHVLHYIILPPVVWLQNMIFTLYGLPLF